MGIPYREAARHFNGRPVRLVMANPERDTFTGTLHPAPHDGLEHVEIRDHARGERVRVDVDDIAELHLHLRSRR